MRRQDRKGKTNMTNYEMVELLRQKANVSYEEAKAALEAANWDLLDAIVLLEREGKVPENDARFSTRTEEEKADEGKKKKDRDGAFKDGARTVGGIFRRMLNYGNRNYIVASRDGKEVISLPLTAIADFEEKSKTDPLFAKLAELVAETNGLWNAKAEKYLLENAPSI